MPGHTGDRSPGVLGSTSAHRRVDGPLQAHPTDWRQPTYKNAGLTSRQPGLPARVKQQGYRYRRLESGTRLSPPEQQSRGRLRPEPALMEASPDWQESLGYHLVDDRAT